MLQKPSYHRTAVGARDCKADPCVASPRLVWQVVGVGQWVVAQLGRPNASKAALASLRRAAASSEGAKPCGLPAGPTLSLDTLDSHRQSSDEVHAASSASHGFLHGAAAFGPCRTWPQQQPASGELRR